MYSKPAFTFARIMPSSNGTTAHAASAGASDSTGASDEQEFVGTGRDDDFFEQQFETVGNRLQQTPLTHAVGTDDESA